MIYMVTLAAVVAFAGYASPKFGLRQSNYKNYLILCGILIAALSSLRSPYVGTGDNYVYLLKYEILQNYENFKSYYNEHMSEYDLLSSEAGYYYTMWLFGHFLRDGQWVFCNQFLADYHRYLSFYPP